MELGEEEHKQFKLWEMEETEADDRKLTRYPCPCKHCIGRNVLARETIRRHVRKYKRDPEFKNSIVVSVSLKNLRKCKYTFGSLHSVGLDFVGSIEAVYPGCCV